jgi:hypothetical protein
MPLDKYCLIQIVNILTLFDRIQFHLYSDDIIDKITLLEYAYVKPHA